MEFPDKLVAQWITNTPPIFDRENDFYLSVDTPKQIENQPWLFIKYFWCVVDQQYVAKPVKVHPDGREHEAEIPLSTEKLAAFENDMQKLGIAQVRGFVDPAQQRPYQEQLADIHPQLIPTIIK